MDDHEAGRERPGAAERPRESGAAALGRGLENFCQFLQVQRINLNVINPLQLQRKIHAALQNRLEVQTSSA